MVNSKGFSSLIILFVIIGVVILLGGFFLFKVKTVKPESSVTPIATPSSNHVEEAGNSKTNSNVSVFEKLNQPTNNSQEFKDCQNDINCFIEASLNCTKAKVTYSYTLEMFGVKQTTGYQYEIRGKESDKCLFYLQIQKVDFALPEGTPDETIKDQSDLYKALEGRNGLCKFDAQDLASVLTKWSQGNFDSGKLSCELTPKGNVCTTVGGDFGKASCTGTYFDTSL